MEGQQNEAEKARTAFVSALRSLNVVNEVGLHHERMYKLRSTLNQISESMEGHFGAETALQLQIAFLQSLPMFLGSGRTTGDAIALVDTVIGTLH